MGIPGLLSFMKEATEDIHIRKYAGKCVAVDTYCWLHRGAFACAEKLAKGEKTDQYIKYCMKFTDMLESYNVRPILVFDGSNLPSKREVEKQRHEKRQLYMQNGKRFLREGKLTDARNAFTKCINITPEMALSVMEVARARCIDCIVAPYEADAQLAYLLKNGYAEAVITEDSDLLCFGCETVIFKMDLTGRAQEVSLSRLENIKVLTGFTTDNFRHMCILSGCDYLPSIKGVGLGKASKAIKEGKHKDVHQVVRHLNQYIKSLAPVDAEYAVGFEKADQTFLYQLVFDPKIRELVPLCPYPDSVAKEDLSFAGPAVTDEKALQIALGNINFKTGRRMGNFDVDSWLKSKNWRNNKMNKCSIWKSDRKNEQSEMKDTGDDVKHQIKRTANLRGQEVVINMHKYSFGGAKKHMDLPSFSEQDAIDQCTQAGTSQKKEKTKMPCDKALENDMSELLDAYKTSVQKKTSLRHRMKRKCSGSELADPNCVVKSRFFATADKNFSFVEEDCNQDITIINETPENSNSSTVNEASVITSIDKELKSIFAEFQTSSKPSHQNIPYLDGKVKDVGTSNGEKVHQVNSKATKRCPTQNGVIKGKENKLLEDKTIVICSDDESIPYIDDIRLRPSKRRKTLGTRRSISSLNKGFTNSTKKSSGLPISGNNSKGKQHTEESRRQPKMTSFFTRKLVPLVKV